MSDEEDEDQENETFGKQFKKIQKKVSSSGRVSPIIPPSSTSQYPSDDGDQQLYDSQDDENLSRQEDEVETMKYEKVLRKAEERKAKHDLEAQIS